MKDVVLVVSAEICGKISVLERSHYSAGSSGTQRTNIGTTFK